MSDTPPDRRAETPEVLGAGAGGLGNLFESAQQALAAQAEASQQEVEGTAGGGVVAVTMTGSGEVTSVTLAPEVVDPDDIEMLQDLIVAALHDAGMKVTELQRRALGAFGGLDLGGLGDMLGGLAGGAPGGGAPGSGAADAGGAPPHSGALGGGAPGGGAPGGGGPSNASGAPGTGEDR